MTNILQWFLVSLSVLALTACGGSSGVEDKADSLTATTHPTTIDNEDIPPTVVDTEAPVFTSLSTVTVAENQIDAITLVATDANTVTYSISGGDGSDFNVNANTGVVTFKIAPDFETKDTYTFTSTATDEKGNEETQDVTIDISDIPEVVGVKKTGQTNSYDEDGNEVTDGSIKDDGFYQKGVTPNYTRDDDKEIVTDHIIGLQWADDANVSSVEKQWLTDANNDACYGSGDPSCYDTSGDTAATYCTNLALGGYSDWRLPTRKELVGIVDHRHFDPAISPVFENINTSSFHSSTTHFNYVRSVWEVDFYLGHLRRGHKNLNSYVRCVRAGQ